MTYRPRGGVEYLKYVAITKPESFMQLLGRVLPLKLATDDGGPVIAIEVTRRIVRPLPKRK